jgi:ferredoxin
MKVHVDATACSGFGACAETCPSVFELDEFGYAAVKTDGGIVSGEEIEAVRTAISRCPENAISAED